MFRCTFDFSVLEVCQKETNSCNSAVAALTSELLVSVAVAGIKSGLFYKIFDVNLCFKQLLLKIISNELFVVSWHLLIVNSEF